MPQARTIEQALEEAGFAQIGVVRLELQEAVIARHSDEAAVAQDIGHAQIGQDGIIVELATRSRADIARIRAGMSRDFLFLINQRCAGAKFRAGELRLDELWPSKKNPKKAGRITRRNNTSSVVMDWFP